MFILPSKAQRDAGLYRVAPQAVSALLSFERQVLLCGVAEVDKCRYDTVESSVLKALCTHL